MAAERVHSIDRRQFLKGVGGALMTLGAIDGYLNIKKEIQISGDVIREVKEQGITPPSQEVLKTAEQIRRERSEYTVAHRNPEAVWQAR
jgi:hypothetical protein